MLQSDKILFYVGMSALFYRSGESGCMSQNNDSSSHSRSLKSSCTGGRVYLNETRKCYHIHSKGPCGELMEVMSNYSDNEIGKCVCQIFACDGRPTVHWIRQNRCYFIFEQGPCPSGHWLVLNNANEAICEQIPCPEEYNLQKPHVAGQQFLFPHEGKCYTSGTPGAGPCPPNEADYFSGMKYACKGSSPNCASVASVGSGSNDCGSGSQSDGFGGC